MLQDIKEAISEIQIFIKGENFDSFKSDPKTLNAVLWSLSTIGEAANKLSSDFTSLHLNINWHQIISFRNRIIHEYFGVDYNLVWDIIQNHLITLQEQIKDILNELD